MEDTQEPYGDIESMFLSPLPPYEVKVGKTKNELGKEDTQQLLCGCKCE
jgi:hypothetical protein